MLVVIKKFVIEKIKKDKSSSTFKILFKKETVKKMQQLECIQMQISVTYCNLIWKS